MNRKIKTLIASIAFVCQGSAAVIAAVPSNEALKAALAKSKLVDPTIEIVSSTEPGRPEHVLISTFMHRSATKDDCKIDALLMSKVIMEAAPEVERVTVSFFSAADAATYQQVSIKRIDIKAFEGGDVNRAELLKTIEVSLPKQTADSPENLTALMRQNSFVRDLQVGVSGKLIDLSARVDLSRSDLDTKLEALQLAKNALAAAPEGVAQVNVKLQDAWEASKTKHVSFDSAELQKMSTAIEGVLAAIAIVPVVQNLVVAGEYQQDRQKLADRIAALGKLGVGTSGFTSYFKTIEASVGKENMNEPSQVLNMIKKLQGILDEQEKMTASAKNRPSQLKKEPEKVAVAPTGHTDKHAVFIGDREFDESRARDQPDIYAKELEDHFMPQKPNGPAHFVDVLQRISQILRADQKVAEAAKFQQWANDVRAHVR